MPEHTTTECLLFPDIFTKPVVAQFDPRQGSSDGGAILLKAADHRYRLIDRLADCLHDYRQPGMVDHRFKELLAQRIFGIASGYPDANDAARLRDDPIHKMLVGRDPLGGTDLASQPTLSRARFHFVSSLARASFGTLNTLRTALSNPSNSVLPGTFGAASGFIRAPAFRVDVCAS